MGKDITEKEFKNVISFTVFALFVTLTFTSFRYGFPIDLKGTWGDSEEGDPSKPTPPSEQISLENKLMDIKKEYESADDANNNMRIRAAEGRMDVFTSSLKEKHIFAESWVCEVTNIMDDKKLSCSHLHVTYHLEHSTSMASLFGDLKAGDLLVFTGKIIEEDSITSSGAINNPELNVKTTNITTASNNG